MRPHLTNTCLQISPSSSPNTPPSTHQKPLVLPFHTLPCPSSKTPNTTTTHTKILTQINTLTSSLFLAATAHPTTFQPLPNAFEVYGLDYLVSESGKVYLLEVNAFPDFAQSGGCTPELGAEGDEGAEEGEEGRGKGGGKEVIAGLWRAVMAVAVKGFFSSGTKDGNAEEKGEEEEEEDEEKWGMKKVLDVDLGRR
ncbi:MAG: hypothetical protein Q9228_005673 [Teloschistes exilis]